MQLEIRNAVERDGLTYNISAFSPLHHRHRLLPQDIVHGRAAFRLDRDPAGARRARLGQFQPQYVPERDDAADHGDQLSDSMQLTFAARDG